MSDCGRWRTAFPFSDVWRHCAAENGGATQSPVLAAVSGGEAKLHIRGLQGPEVLCGSSSSPQLVWPLADDPNAPNLLRPDDRHGLLLTDGKIRPEDALTTVPIARDGETVVECT